MARDTRRLQENIIKIYLIFLESQLRFNSFPTENESPSLSPMP
jgi:hypothetical protein